MQQWFNLSDPGVEEALYDSLSMRRFAGIDLGEMPVPDESTVCRFRHLLEAHALGKKLLGVALILRPQCTVRLGNRTTFSGISTVPL